MIIHAIIALSLLLTCLASPAQGLERFEIITTQELQQMLHERESGDRDFVLVNTLDTLIYEHHSIPGSVNIPWSRVTEMKGLLGTDQNRLIITYCMGYR